MLIVAQVNSMAAFIDVVDPMKIPLTEVDASFHGEERGERIGRQVSGTGDVNGDGLDDILIGVDSYPIKKTYLILGKSKGWEKKTDLIDSDASFLEANIVGRAGDVNGDGLDDILVGNLDYQGDSRVSKTYMFFGKKDGWIKIMSPSMANTSFIGLAREGTGYSIDGGGDVNGDGYDDILIGDPYGNATGYNSGIVHLIFGRASGWRKDVSLGEANVTFNGEGAMEYAGTSIDIVGDVNRDGFDDVLIGAPMRMTGNSSMGMAYLFLGRSDWNPEYNLSAADVKFRDFKKWTGVGYSVSGAGDMNRDGFDDIIIGAPWVELWSDYSKPGVHNHSRAKGKIYLIFGRSSGWPPEMNLTKDRPSFVGENDHSNLGYLIAGVGDVDKNGFGDLMMVGQAEKNSLAYLIRGKAEGLGHRTEVSEANPSWVNKRTDKNGRIQSIAGAGDVNGDGRDDILIGTPLSCRLKDCNGEVFLIFVKWPDPDIPKIILPIIVVMIVLFCVFGIITRRHKKGKVRGR